MMSSASTAQDILTLKTRLPVPTAPTSAPSAGDPDFIGPVQPPAHTPGFVGPVQPPPTETDAQRYDRARERLRATQDDLRHTHLSILSAPIGTKFTDTEGKEYSTIEAASLISTSRRHTADALDAISRYESQGYRVRETDTGLEFYKTPEDVWGETLSSKIAEITPYYDRPTMAGLGHAVSTSFSQHDPFGIVSTGHLLTGGKEGYLRAKAEASIKLDTALKGGFLSYTLDWMQSPVALIGATFLGGAALQAIGGKLAAGAATAALGTKTGLAVTTAKVAPYVFKGGVAAVGVGMGAMAVKDIVETKDPWLKVGKAATLGAAIWGGYKGYQAAGGKAGIAAKVHAAEKKFYAQHPDRVPLHYMKKGVLAGTGSAKPKSELFISRGTPKEVSRTFEITGRAYKPGKQWVAMSEAALKDSRPGTTIQGMKTTQVKGMEFIPGEKGVTARPLTESLSAMKMTMRTGEVKAGFFKGRRIFDFTGRSVRHTKDLSTRELGGSGGVTKTVQVPKTLQDIEFGDLSKVVFGPSTGFGSAALGALGGVAIGSSFQLDKLSNDLKPAVFHQEMKEAESLIRSPNTFSGQGTGLGDDTVFDTDLSFHRGFVPAQEFDDAFDFVPMTQTTGAIDLARPGPPITFERPFPTFPGIIPRRGFLSGLDEDDFGFGLDIFGRTKKAGWGDPLKEMNKLSQGFRKKGLF
jgi:hypothetical protein